MSDLMKRAKRWEKFHEPMANAVNARFMVDNIWKGIGSYLDYKDRERTQTREDERLQAYKDTARRADEDRDREYEFARDQVEYGRGRDSRQDLIDAQRRMIEDQDRARGIRHEDEDRKIAAEERARQRALSDKSERRADTYLDIQQQNLDINEAEATARQARERAGETRAQESHDFNMEVGRDEVERQKRARAANAKNARRLLKDPQFGDAVRRSFPAEIDPDTMSDEEISDAFEQYVHPRLQQEAETQDKLRVEREKALGDSLKNFATEEGGILSSMGKNRARADEIGTYAGKYLDESGNLRPEYEADEGVEDPLLAGALGDGYAVSTYGDIPRAVQGARARVRGDEERLMGLRRSREDSMRYFSGGGGTAVSAAQQTLDGDEQPVGPGEQPAAHGSPTGPSNLPTQNVSESSTYTPPHLMRRAQGERAGKQVPAVYSQSIGGERRDPARVAEMVATGVLSPDEIGDYMGEAPNFLGFESEPQRAVDRIRRAAEGSRDTRRMGRTPIEVDDEVNAAYPRSLFGMETPLGGRVRVAQSGNVVQRLNALATEPGYGGARAIDNPNPGMIEAAALLADQLEPEDLDRLLPAARRLVEMAQRQAR